MINLLPPKAQKAAKLQNIQNDVLKYGLALLLFSILSVALQFLGYLYINQQKDGTKVEISDKEEELKKINTGQEEAIQLSQDIDTIGQLLKRRVDFAELIQEIGGALPAGANLNNLSLGSSNREPINMVFTVDSQKKAAILRQNLEDSGVFTGADIQNISVVSTDETGSALIFSTSIITKFSDEYLQETVESKPLIGVPQDAGGDN